MDPATRERIEEASASFVAAFLPVGEAAQRATLTLAELFANAAHQQLKKAYSGQPPAWPPLTRRTDPTIGRKRRSRRARGRACA
jgi:hypothetical protein